ncbi:hypothetical protein [Methylorubrum thiocyanatum]
MSEPERLARLSVPQDAKQAGMMIGVLAPALLTTLQALATQHGNQNGAWFEDLSKDLLKKAKGNEGVGAPMSDEATGITLGLDALQAILDVVRRDLA